MYCIVVVNTFNFSFSLALLFVFIMKILFAGLLELEYMIITN
jgi:hypothetical protein